MRGEFSANRLALRGLMYYWRTNAAVVLGVATAVAVLTGALLVGDSVRGSLRDIVLQRLGRTNHVVVSSGFFREQLAEDLRKHPQFQAVFDNIVPVILTQGFVTLQSGSASAGQVNVYGVDDRFWAFHGVAALHGPAADRDALLSPALARELGADDGETLLVRVRLPSDIPVESLHGRKDDLGRTVRATVRGVLPGETLGEFSLQASQGDVRAVFLPMARLQQDLDVKDRANALLVSARTEAPGSTAALQRLVKENVQLEDSGLKLRILESRSSLALESDGGVLNDAQASAALVVPSAMGLQPQPVFTYLANSLRSAGREVPYSLVAAIDIPELAPEPGASGPPPMLLNEWAARDMQAAKGSRVTMEYYIWEEPGRLTVRSMEFTVAGVVPIDQRDRDYVPVYPGITDSATLTDWDPPFPIDMSRVRPVDEQYWKDYGTTPKAFIHFAVGHQLWHSRYMAATSFRVRPEAGAESERPLAELAKDFGAQLRARLNPLESDMAVLPVRAQALQAARGATDFGAYFVYFSSFLVVSALLLAALFFKLNVEQRAREVGLLRAVGFPGKALRRVFLTEGLLLGILGTLLGVPGGLLYGYGMVTALRTWWIGAVGTSSIALHVSTLSLAVGALGGLAAATACIAFTLRSLGRVSERSLLAGEIQPSAAEGQNRGRWRLAALAFGVAGIALMAAGSAAWIGKAFAFFGAGAALLVASLCFFSFQFGRPSHRPIEGTGWYPIWKLGLRNAAHRPARSILSVAMIASATFILISVDAFRKAPTVDSTNPQTGTGGYPLLVESLLPLVHDPASVEGRAALGLSDAGPITFEPFRVRAGDDASCLNLYEPKNPRILAPTLGFIASGRFAFQDSQASSEAERKDPWLLLLRHETDSAVPVIADANSMTYVLHRKLGEDVVIDVRGRPVRLRLVAALSDSIFQSALLMSQENFLRLFPEEEGYRFLLVDTPADRAAAVSAALEQALGDYGADVKSTAERLAEFHRVENTYLSTFQMLGGLGLLLGTAGIGAVLLRNALERRRELALLRALGYRRFHFFALAVSENALLLAAGLVTGGLCALLAIVPVLIERGGHLPAGSLLLLLAAVFVGGLATSVIATAAALRTPLLSALQSE